MNIHYFNLAPNYDDTFTLRSMSKRGVQLQNEFRYLNHNYQGKLRAEWFSNVMRWFSQRDRSELFHLRT